MASRLRLITTKRAYESHLYQRSYRSRNDYLSDRQADLAQGTAFSYQGWLLDNGNPTDGTYDLSFAVFDASSGGNQVGATLTSPGTLVNNGLFIATLDFGTGIFTGATRWLEIGVRPSGDGGLSRF